METIAKYDTFSFKSMVKLPLDIKQIKRLINYRDALNTLVINSTTITRREK